MTITRNQLRNAVVNAEKLGNTRDAKTIRDLAGSLKKWGKLTPRQAEFAAVLIERNSNEKVKQAAGVQKAHSLGWDEPEYREWLLFLARFFSGSKQNAYLMHIQNRRVAANTILAHHLGGSVPNWKDCESLLKSKLAPRLREIYENPPIYSAGELVNIRRSELSYWEVEAGKGCLMGIIVEVEPTHVDTVTTYNPTKGGTKTYKVLFPETGDQATLRENQIKLVSRKNHNKE